MYVKDHMTLNPITVNKEITLSQALEIMGKNRFHRLPVVDEEGKLIGLLTEGLINDSSGKKATSLSIYELNYLLSRTRAEDVMIREVKSISPDVFLEEAADAMVRYEINVLPVVDRERKVIGIITDKDIFQTFVDLMGTHRSGTRFVLEVQDVPGEFAQITRLFAEEKANLENLAVYHRAGKAEVVVKTTGEVSPERMIEVLRQNGYVVTNVVQMTNEGKNVIPLES